MIQLVFGGARSGKSSFAEQLATEAQKPVLYVATATAGDKEMQARIQRHQAQRPAQWALLEEPLALPEVIRAHSEPSTVLLVDCLTLWLSNVLLSVPANTPVDEQQCGEQHMEQGEQGCEAQRTALCEALAETEADVILVSNEVGMGIVPMGAINRQFVDHAGWLNQAVARVSDRVVWVAAGLPVVLKGPALL